jgi:hypothetical protein
MCALWNITKPEDEAVKRSRQLASSILADALDQRAKFRLTFEDKTTSIKDISATLINFGAAGVVVEISALKKASQSFVGAAVSCYFSVRDRANKSVSNFYTFNSSVRTVQLQPNGVVSFVLVPPAEVTPAQQRRSVRVSVDQERMPLFLAWRELPPGANIAEAPPLFSAGPQGQGQVKVDNISSFGLRLMVQNAFMGEVLPKQNTGEVFSFYFKAVAEEDGQEKTFLANAVLRNIFSDPQQGETSLGFEFVAVGGLNKQKRLVWTPLKANGLADLSAFIFKWNLLDFYREKRVSEG